MRRTARIFYYTPDHNVPSWGMGMLYSHVNALARYGFEAYVLHLRSPFRLEWLRSKAPIVYLNSRDLRIRPWDILVVPEILAAHSEPQSIRCRKITFVQGSSLIVAGLGGKRVYPELGYEAAIAIMPHVRKVIESHFGIPAPVVPPYIAPYFFASADKLHRRRKRQIALYPKVGGEDYPILKAMLEARARAGRGPHRLWRTVELAGKTHREVARILGESAFHVNVNCQESFNAMVPEAMAAGCIPICYEGYGGRDYLRNRKNAYVFPNHYIFPLLNRVLSLMDSYDSMEPELARIRQAAYDTACRYTEEAMAHKLVAFFRSVLSSHLIR